MTNTQSRINIIDRIKIIDSHQHFWKMDRGDYDWLDSSLGILYKDYKPQDLKPILEQFNIEKTVLVQAAATIEETEFMLSLADQHDFIGGVVGWVNLESDSAIDDIYRLAKHPKLKGIRPMLQDIEDTGWIAKPDLSPAINALIENNLRFDALVMTQNIDSLLVMMSRHPNLPIVIDHGAKPAIASGDLSLWKEQIKQLSLHKGTYCKLSGLLTECAESQTIEDIRPVFEHLFDCFGPDRLMWGSDWPVVRLRGEYSDWLSMTNALLSNLSQDIQTNILRNNAIRFYNL